MTSRERMLAVLNGEKPDRIPVFPLLMHFAANRSGMTYRQYASSGESLAEAQANIFRGYAIDAVTACSDAFRITADLGAEMVFPEQTPPFAASHPVARRGDIAKLRRPDPHAGRMGDRVLGVRQLARAVGDECLVLGWVDMPFAECCSICGVTEFMMLLYDDPAMARELLEFVTPIVVDFALAQLEAGAPMLGAGDAAASMISPGQYREFALPFERNVCDKVHERGGLVKLHICGNTTRLLEDMCGSGADLFNVDHMVNLGRAACVYGKAGKAFKGNLDPVADILQSTAGQCRSKALRCIEMAGNAKYMLSAGCEIPAAANDEVFDAFCSAAG